MTGVAEGWLQPRALIRRNPVATESASTAGVRLIGTGRQERIILFVETVSAPTEVWRHWTDRLRLFSEPPPALFASIAWDNGDGTVSALNVWDHSSAVADFFLERVEEADARRPGQGGRRQVPAPVGSSCPLTVLCLFVAPCSATMAEIAAANGWEGLIINGAVRDAALRASLDIGVKMSGRIPEKGSRTGPAIRTSCSLRWGSLQAGVRRQRHPKQKHLFPYEDPSELFRR